MLSRSPVNRFVATLCLLGLAALGVFVAVGFVGGTDTARAKGPTDIRGRWAWVSEVGSQKYPQTMTISTQDLTTGTFSGVDRGRGLTMNITGKVTGNRFTLHLKQRGAAYTADAKGTIELKKGKLSMSGTFTDNAGHRGTFTAKGGAPADPEETPEPSPTPSPTPGNGLGYDDPPHNIHLDERPPVCTDPSLVIWGPDGIGRLRYISQARYRPCLLQLNPGVGSVKVSYETTLTKWGSEWDRYRVDTTGGTVTRPDGRAVPITTWDFGTQSACFLSECPALYPWYNPLQLYWSAEDSRIEWVPVVTGVAVLPTNPDTGPQYARTTCIAAKPCEILVQRPPMLERGVPYWVRLSVFGYCQEQYTGVQGSCGGEGMTVAAREFLADANPGGSAVGPTAAFIATQHDPDAPWVFDPAGSTASAPATIVKWEWDLGDRTKTTSPKPTHEYAEPGRYHVTLKVTDSIGRTATVAQDIGEADTAIVVNSTGDASRGPKAGDACDTGERIGSKPECTLRAAIETVNRRDGGSTITFAIKGDGIPAIQHTTRYEPIAKPVVIDGTSQAGGWVQLTGPSDKPLAGLALLGGDSRVTGLAISGFAPALQVSGEGNVIEGNRIGTDPSGTTASSSTSGISLGGATNTTIRENVVAGQLFAIWARKGATATITGNHIGVTDAGRPLGTLVGIYVAPGDGGGAWTIADNTLIASRFGIVTRGTAAAGSTIRGNTISLPPEGQDRITFGILLDGTPGVTIADNPSIIASGGVDIGLTGTPQAVDSDGGVTFSLVDHPITGTVTGGQVTISGNTLGLDAAGRMPADRSRTGVLSYGAAPAVRVEGNLIAGHTTSEVRIVGGSDHQVTGNRIGVNRFGTGALGGSNGLDVAGVTDVLVQGNLIGGMTEAAVRVEGDRNSSPEASRRVTIVGNRIGVTNDTRMPLRNRVGIAVNDSEGTTIGPDNIVSGNDFGITAAGAITDLTISGNVVGSDRRRLVAVPNGTGIAMTRADATVAGNSIIGNTGYGIDMEGGTADVLGNDIGVGANGTRLGNGVGVRVSFAASASLYGNTIANNAEDGLRIESGAKALFLTGSTFANGGKGIGGEAALAPPILKVVDVGSGASARRWFVASGTGSRILGIYGNTDCTDPDEGRTLLPTKEHGLSPREGVTQVVSATVKRSYAGYTALLLDDKNTSVFSNCATPARYPDTSGTGIPDVIQLALGGDPRTPATVSFPGDIGTIKLETTHGRFTNVAPGVTPPTTADMPLGAFSYQVTGLTPGARDTVLLTSSTAILRSYWRYGRETRSAPMRWYSWMYDAINHTGPRVTGSQVIINLVDGGDGDDDVLANGIIQQ